MKPPGVSVDSEHTDLNGNYHYNIQFKHLFQYFSLKIIYSFLGIKIDDV